MKTSTKTMLALGLALATTITLATPALAATPEGKGAGSGSTQAAKLAALQTIAKTETSTRITALNTAITKVTANKYITAADKSTVLNVLNNDVTGMNSVEAKVAADTTLAAAKADYKTMFTTYRVYAVAIPGASYATASDDITGNALPKLVSAEAKLSAALNGKEKTKSTPALQADLTDMQTQITAATNALNGNAAAALAVSPDTFNSNHNVFAPIRANVVTARASVKTAIADGKTILAALKA